MKPKREIIPNTQNKCGESPIWDPFRQRLLWTDHGTCELFELVPQTGTQRTLSRGLMIAGAGLHRNGGLVCVGTTGAHLWRGRDDFETFLTAHDGETLCFNDMIVDPQGRVYAGTLYWGANGMEKYGKLYLIDDNGRPQIVDDGIKLANGLGFSPDNQRLYFADSAARAINSYDVDPQSGALKNKRLFARVPPEEGIPDGLTVDGQGFVWSAQWYGAQIVRYDPDGAIERKTQLPVLQVSSLAFGGPDFSDLYITTAGESWPSHLAPPGCNFNASNIGGPLYRLKTGLQGKPEYSAAIHPKTLP